MYFLLFLLYVFEPPKYYKYDISIWSLYIFRLACNYLVYYYRKKSFKTCNKLTWVRLAEKAILLTYPKQNNHVAKFEKNNELKDILLSYFIFLVVMLFKVPYDVLLGL